MTRPCPRWCAGLEPVHGGPHDSRLVYVDGLQDEISFMLTAQDTIHLDADGVTTTPGAGQIIGYVPRGHFALNADQAREVADALVLLAHTLEHAG